MQNVFGQKTFLNYYNKFKIGDPISSFDRGHQLMELEDGYVVFGWKEEKTIGGIYQFSDTTRPLIMKVDKHGIVLWNKRYRNNTCNFALGNCIKNSRDELIGAGTSLMPGDSCGFWPSETIPQLDNQLYIQKINDQGEIIWQKTIGESENKTAQGAVGITPTKDGNYFIIGIDNDFPWLLKINEQGDTLWTKKYPSLFGKGVVLITSTNGGYLIFSYFGSLITKINEQGDLIWTKNSPKPYGGIKPSKDGGFLLLTYTQISTQVFTVITKIDNDLNYLWQKTYSAYGFNAMCETSDGNYIICNKDFAKVSPDGKIIWNKRFWGLNNITPWYYFLDVMETSDGGYLATGFYDGNTFLIKTDCNGNLEWDTQSCLLPTEQHVLAFPNPFSDNITFQLPDINKDEDKVTVKLTNTLGQIIFTQDYFDQNIITLNSSSISDGLYIYSIYLNEQLYKSDKIIKAKTP